MVVVTTASPSSSSRRAQPQREDGEDLIAVDDRSGVVDGQHAIAVAVEGEPEVALRAARRPRRAASRSVEPHPTLMLMPSGASPMTATSVGAEPVEHLRCA